MSYLEELLPEFRKGAKIRQTDWDVDVRIYFDNDQIYWQDNGSWKNGKLASTKDLVSLFTFHEDNWEIYDEERAYWDTIIKNKCLCYFWGDCEKYAKEYGFLGFLTYVQPSNNTDRFEDLEGKIWKHCCPVRRDEVTFYEDKKDE